jgi:hypothetical protein
MASTKKPIRGRLSKAEVNRIKEMPKPKSQSVGTKKLMPKITTAPSSRRKNVIPPDYDVILPGMGYTKPTKKSPPKKIKKK